MNTLIKPRSCRCPALINTHAWSQLSRLSPTHSAHIQQQEDAELDADAEGDGDIEGDDAKEDLTPYCFYRAELSSHSTIGCDVKNSPYHSLHTYSFKEILISFLVPD
jgi:hypothetical protein